MWVTSSDDFFKDGLAHEVPSFRRRFLGLISILDTVCSVPQSANARIELLYLTQLPWNCSQVDGKRISHEEAWYDSLTLILMMDQIIVFLKSRTTIHKYRSIQAC